MPPRMRVSHVLLDVDGTLVDYGTAAQAAFLAAAERASMLVGHEVLAAELFRARTALGDDPAWRDRPVAALRHESFRRVLAAHGVGADTVVREVMSAYEAARDAALTVFPDVTEGLAALAALRLTLIAASNGNIDLGRVGLGAHIAATHYAHDVGVSKPDPRFFELAAQRFGLRPRATVVVGDRLDNDYAPALAAGMHAVLLDRSNEVDGEGVVRAASLVEVAALLERG